MMLLAEALSLLYQREDLAEKVIELDSDLQESIPMTSLHLLIRILASQRDNGSWDDICEVTSYGTLALLYLSKLPWIQQLGQDAITEAMSQSQVYLVGNRSEWAKGHYLWIEKVTYASDLLSEAYCLAAALAPAPQSASHDKPSQQRASRLVPEKTLLSMNKAGSMLRRVPLFSGVKPPVLRAAEMQACWALGAMQRQPPGVFPPSEKQQKGQQQKYMLMIPLAFMACAAAQQPAGSVSINVMYEMIVLSLLNFQVDEYMETVVETHFRGRLHEVTAIIEELFGERRALGRRRVNGVQASDSPKFEGQGEQKVGCLPGENHDLDQLEQQGTNGLDAGHAPGVRVVLSQFIDRILNHPAALASPPGHRARLGQDLKTFLLAHVTHAEDNHRFNHQHQESVNGTQHHTTNGDTTNGHAANGAQNGAATLPFTSQPDGNPREYADPGRTFYSWVRSTSADHTSCPFSFVFFNMLVRASAPSTAAAAQADVYGSARTAYLAEDLCRHLASLCRMYNDLGSLGRDAEEGNVNSVNWPEFHLGTSGAGQRIKRHVTNGAAKPTEVNGNKESSLRKVKQELLGIAEYERCGMNLALGMLKDELQSEALISALELFINVTDLYGQVYVLEDIGIRTK
jgi:hypothetical protein